MSETVDNPNFANPMIFVTPSQLAQIGRKCSMCDEKAQWLDKFDENSFAYCDRHFPGRVCECEICQTDEK